MKLLMFELFAAKIDFNVDFTHKLCAALMLHSARNSGSPLSLIIGSLCIKHPNLFGKSEKLDVLWDKGLYDSNIFIAYRKPKPEWLPQQSFVVQHSVSPEIGVHGVPVDNFSRSGSGGVNLCRLSAGLDLSEPASSNWSSKTSIKFEHVRPMNDEGYSISRDPHGFPVTCSGGYHDSMVVIKQESRFAKANERSFTRFTLQIEQGIPLLSKWLIFNRFKFNASKGVRLGPAFLLTSLTGGSIVGDIAPYQAFAIGGLGSVRGYGEGAVGTGRSCLVANNELTLPLNQMLEGAVFLDCGSDLGSGRHVPGNPSLRHGKPGSGMGLGYGLRFKSPVGHLQVDYAVNALQQRTANLVKDYDWTLSRENLQYTLIEMRSPTVDIETGTRAFSWKIVEVAYAGTAI
ncbi:OLC1v1004803C2 [Oldenlandia corymbosa var. corymbosa]|uniref:OLC1v1004803C2 n=1 Tax=Oldenlandia corymbosa var. corymbosa TaxID=529605 RepID=A0AAV1DD65_OLDCO|nr:OLC1v1004803C2 [Oldenlandia corymbosa var. corymbosa]